MIVSTFWRAKSALVLEVNFLGFGDEPLITLYTYRWVRLWSALATQLACSEDYCRPELPHDSSTELLVTWQLSLERQPSMCSYLAILTRVACDHSSNLATICPPLIQTRNQIGQSARNWGFIQQQKTSTSTIHYLYHEILQCSWRSLIQGCWTRISADQLQFHSVILEHHDTDAGRHNM